MASISEASTLAPASTTLALRPHWVDVAWWCFVAANAWGMLMLRDWATVPFHFIWIGVSLMYGWRVWTMKVTVISLAVIVVLTGAALVVDVAHGFQEPDELTEIPLMSAVFLVMVLHVRHRVTAQQETERIAAHNLTLVEQSRIMVQNTSHALRTPLTIALGHAELLQRTATDAETVEDARVVVAELNRLKSISDRFLRLARSEQPDFLYPVQTAMGGLVATTVARWTAVHASVQTGVLQDDVLPVDPTHVAEAIDEMIGNAIAHCPPSTPVEVTARRAADHYVISVADRGPGVPDSLADSLFERFNRGQGASSSGAGLGLAIVKAITEGHGGWVDVRHRVGGGTVFAMSLPHAVPARDLIGSDGSPGA
ncbi:MAG TPA: HAMP domain-containing sensor histidine kinase [Nocardioides sp.]|jgi:signal transduction histidine kinase|uniref:sensor histidine kinase n=1 Tax=Nocardioides sp. TaxID=35761 RepID=UPI002E36B263|nr:HAMP domain-containing sensor histidine kinase [Nocardioides sp.]HEX3931058.1 HAMP domain-containing sensor histidine kinase [Nocardioides sp.]